MTSSTCQEQVQEMMATPSGKRCDSRTTLQVRRASSDSVPFRTLTVQSSDDGDEARGAVHRSAEGLSQRRVVGTSIFMELQKLEATQRSSHELEMLVVKHRLPSTEKRSHVLRGLNSLTTRNPANARKEKKCEEWRQAMKDIHWLPMVIAWNGGVHPAVSETLQLLRPSL